MSAPPCPACGSVMEVFHEVTGVPVNSCRLVDDAPTARGLPLGDLRLGFCGQCGFIANTAFDEALTTYDGEYEETQGFSPRFQTFAAELAQRWVDTYDLHGKRILEVGCGKAEFLVRLAELGPNVCIGVDPAAVRSDRAPAPTSGSVTLVPERYGPRHAVPPPDAVVCRHTLEHIGPVRDFLQLLRAGTENHAVLLFELPDTERVLRDGALEDVYYEHCSYFTAGSLSRLFRRCGFEVLALELAYEGQYLVLEARLGTPDTQLTSEDLEDVARTREAVEQFRHSYARTADLWRARLREASGAGRRTVLWGGSSKAVAFLTTLGVGDAVAAVVDINPHKQGKAVPGSGHPVVSPQSLVQAPPDLVIVMNAVYVEEIRAMLADLGLTPELAALGA